MGEVSEMPSGRFMFKGPMPPLQFNMARYCLSASAGAFGGKAGLVVIADACRGEPQEVWTFRQLEDGALRIAAALRERGLTPGARIMIRLDNTSLYALMFFGAIAGGFVPLPTSDQLTAEEAAFVLTDAGAEAIALNDRLAMGQTPPGVAIISEDEARAMLHHAHKGDYADTARDDPAFLIYTSGTTARPKGVVHAHRAAWGRRPMYQGWYGISANDRVLHAGAFNWTFTLGTGLCDPWANAATSIIYTGEKDPAVWPGLVTQSGATMLAAVPGLFRQILKYAPLSRGNMPTLRHGLIAGETPPPGLFDDWTGATGRPLYEALGMSEISTYVSCAPGVPRRPGAVGKAQPFRQIAILDEHGGTSPLPVGEPGLLGVHRSDPGMMLGYWKRPEEEAEVIRGDWFVGGDLASISADGYVTHLGRANDVMKALGYRVSPKEIEAVLAQHHDVAEAACAAHEVQPGVNVVAAYVVAREGTKPSSEELLAFAAEHLAEYKRPRLIVFLDSLPRTANGKVRRSALGADSI